MVGESMTAGGSNRSDFVPGVVPKARHTTGTEASGFRRSWLAVLLPGTKTPLAADFRTRVVFLSTRTR